MRHATLLTAFTFTLAACAAQKVDTGQPAAPKTEQQRLLTMGYFDIGTLSAAPPAIAGRVSDNVLVGVEVAARPLVMECLVDPKNRGADKKTKVVIDATLGDAGVDHKITGENLTPAGVACIDGAMRTWTQGSAALTAKNADGAVKSHIEIEHTVGANPAVVLGVNDVSDVAGAIRLALPSWGDCLEDWKTAPPRTLEASVKVVKPTPAATPTVAPAEVKFDATTDATAGKVAACLEGKLKALQVKAPASSTIVVPFTFSFVHSGIDGTLPGATPDLQFSELALQRNRHGAEAAVAAGERDLAASAYDAVVKRFKAKSKPEPSLDELRSGCAALVAADDKLIAAAEKQGAVDEATRSLAAEQGVKDASWKDAETSAASRLAQAQKDVTTFKAMRQQDEASCPRVTY